MSFSGRWSLAASKRTATGLGNFAPNEEARHTQMRFRRPAALEQEGEQLLPLVCSATIAMSGLLRHRPSALPTLAQRHVGNFGNRVADQVADVALLLRDKRLQELHDAAAGIRTAARTWQCATSDLIEA